MCADLEMNLELMAVDTDPVLNTSLHRLGCSLQGVSLAVVWKGCNAHCPLSHLEGYCLQFPQSGSAFLEGAKQMGFTEGGVSLSHMLEVLTWEL